MSPAPEPRLAFLDSLRGLAAAWVVLFHLVFIPNPDLAVPGWAFPWVRVGGMGVTLFFVVSAFSLCYTMPAHQKEPSPLFSFYARRFFRIAPLFYVLLAFTLLRDKLAFGQAHAPATVAESLAFLFNLVPGKQEGIVWASWTIGVEMLFYLLFPLFYLWTRDAYRAGAFLFLTLVASPVFKLSLTYLPVEPDKYFYWSFLRHLPVFVLGMVAFRLRRAPGGADAQRRVGWLLVSLSLLLFMALIHGWLEGLFLESYYWQATMFVALLLGLAHHPLPWVVNGATRFLGKLSYSLYLNHPPLILFLIPVYRVVYGWPLLLSLKYLIVVGVTFAVLVPLSYLTYRFIEEPGIRFGKGVVRGPRTTCS